MCLQKFNQNGLMKIRLIIIDIDIRLLLCAEIFCFLHECELQQYYWLWKIYLSWSWVE